MNLWEAAGVSPQTALLAAAAGIVVAIVMAATFVVRRSRAKRHEGLGLQ
jgi:biopolymer transport protein ExbB/TolQ